MLPVRMRVVESHQHAERDEHQDGFPCCEGVASEPHGHASAWDTTPTLACAFLAPIP